MLASIAPGTLVFTWEESERRGPEKGPFPILRSALRTRSPLCGSQNRSKKWPVGPQPRPQLGSLPPKEAWGLGTLCRVLLLPPGGAGERLQCGRWREGPLGQGLTAYIWGVGQQRAVTLPPEHRPLEVSWSHRSLGACLLLSLLQPPLSVVQIDSCFPAVALAPPSASLLQSAAAAPSPVMGAMAPSDAMAAGPVTPGFFQVGASFVSRAEAGVCCRLYSGCEHVRTLSQPGTGVGLCPCPPPLPGRAP